MSLPTEEESGPIASKLLDILQARQQRDNVAVINHCFQYLEAYPYSTQAPRARFYLADAYCRSALDEDNLPEQEILNRLTQGHQNLVAILDAAGDHETRRVAETYKAQVKKIINNQLFQQAQETKNVQEVQEIKEWYSFIGTDDATALLWRLELAAMGKDRQEVQMVVEEYLNATEVEAETYKTIMAALVNTSFRQTAPGELDTTRNELLEDSRCYYAHVILASQLLEKKLVREATRELETAYNQVQRVKTQTVKTQSSFQVLAEQDAQNIASSLVGLYKRLARSNLAIPEGCYSQVLLIDSNDLEARLYLARQHFLHKDWAEAGREYALVWKGIAEIRNTECYHQMLAGGDLAAFLLLYLNTGATVESDQSGFWTAVLPVVQSYPDAGLCELIIKLQQAEQQQLPLQSKRARKLHFGFDPLSIQPAPDTPYDWLRKRIQKLAEEKK